MHDFDFKGAAEMPRPYDPADYGLPVWKDEDHQPPETVAEQEPQTVDGVIEDYTNRAIAIANDNRHGYSQQNRWGPDYDCSSMVIQCLQDAGIPAKDRGATFTGNMREVLSDCGFKNVIDSCNLHTAEGMKRGDILLNDANHTAIYLCNGQLVHARSSEGNTFQGDQSGNEIRIQPYYNYPWTAVFRYAEDKPTNVPTNDVLDIDVGSKPNEQRFYELRFPYLQRGSVGEAVRGVQRALRIFVDGEFGDDTEAAVLHFQRNHALNPDGVVGPLTAAVLFGGEVYTPPVTAAEAKDEPKANSFWDNLLTKIKG